MNSIVKTAKLTILACGTCFAAQRKAIWPSCDAVDGSAFRSDEFVSRAEEVARIYGEAG
jgi:hypothetical protein